MITVSQLWRYPVKSMQGEQVDHLDLGPEHAAGDRQWAAVDTESGRAMSAKRYPALLMAAARLDGERAVVTLPDGAELVAGEPATDAALSDWLGRPVELRRIDPDTQLEHSMHADPLDDDTEVVGWPTPKSHFADLAGAHLLTTASLRAAAAQYPGGAWDVRRFRPTALLDVPQEDGTVDDYVEDAWVGGTVQLGGEAAVAPFMPTVRCAMPGRAQPGLDRDPDITRTLRAHHDLNLGVYCGITTPGTVRVGDTATVSPA